MAQVAKVIDRDTAAVNRCFAGLEGFERFRTACQAVGEAQGHGRSAATSEVTASPNDLSGFHPSRAVTKSGTHDTT